MQADNVQYGEHKVSLQSSVMISGDVLSRDLEGEAVVLNLETGVYFGLNEVGTRIWSLLQEHTSLQKIFEIIKEEYDVPPEILENDLLWMIHELSVKGLVSLS